MHLWDILSDMPLARIILTHIVQFTQHYAVCYKLIIFLAAAHPLSLGISVWKEFLYTCHL